MTESQPPSRELLGGAGSLASVTSSDHGASLVLAITGELDISNIDAIADVIHRLPNTDSGLLIDLTEVSYLDSSAVSLLHDLAMRLSSRAQRLIVVSPPETAPRRILDLTALDVNAPVVDALEGGLGMLSAGSSAPP